MGHFLLLFLQLVHVLSQSCQSLYLDCPAPNAANPSEPNACLNDTIECRPENKAQQWNLPTSQYCKCADGWTGFNCQLERPSRCAGTIFDGTTINFAANKRFDCSLIYDPNSIIGTQASFVDHRAEFFLGKAFNGVLDANMTLYSRSIINQSTTCSRVLPVFHCDVTQCTGELDNNGIVTYRCPRAECYTCSDPVCESWLILIGFVNDLPFTFSFSNNDQTQGTALAALKVEAGPLVINLEMTCKTGICVDQIIQPAPPPRKGSVSPLVVTGVLVGVFTAVSFVALSVCFFFLRRVKSRKTEEELFLVSGSEDSQEASGVEVGAKSVPMQEFAYVKHDSRSDLTTTMEEKRTAEDSPGGGRGPVGTISEEAATASGAQHEPKPLLEGAGLVFDDLHYEVTLPTRRIRKVLNGMYGIILPGELVAIVGPSGGGKTTLLNALAGYYQRLPGQLSGAVNLYGTLRGSRRELISYVLQEETLIPTDTVREALRFSAVLRSHPSFSRDMIKKNVDNVISELGLEDVADSMIGDPSFGGLSGGERKRVAIGVELVTHPGLLILDEPMSGLDSFKVGSSLQLLKDISRQGVAVVLTIHQMSARHFQFFDKILAVTKKGELGYLGPPSALGDFLAKNNMAIPSDENPADFLLKIVTQPQTCGPLAAAFKNSPLGLKLMEDIKEAQAIREKSMGDDKRRSTVVAPSTPPPDSIHLFNRPAKNVFVQFWFILLRAFKYQARAPTAMLLTLLLSIIVSLVIGIVFYQVDPSVSGTQNRIGGLFFMIIYFSFTALSAISIFINQRVVLEKEHAASYYGVGSFYWAQILADAICLRIFPPLVFGLICYFMIGFQAIWDKFLLFLIILVLIHLTAAAWCCLISAGVRSLAQALIISMVFLIFTMMFGGNFLNNTTDNPLVNLRWISFTQYAYEALFVNEFHELPLVLSVAGLGTVAVKGDLFMANFGMKLENRDQDIGIVVVWCTFFLLVGYALLSYKSMIPNRRLGRLDY